MIADVCVASTFFRSQCVNFFEFSMLGSQHFVADSLNFNLLRSCSDLGSGQRRDLKNAGQQDGSSHDQPRSNTQDGAST